MSFAMGLCVRCDSGQLNRSYFFKALLGVRRCRSGHVVSGSERRKCTKIMRVE